MFLRYNYLGILWALAIFFLCTLPPSEMPDGPPFKHFDKTVHFFLYFQLSLLQITGFIKQFQFRRIKNNPVACTFIISFVYGIIIELLQGFLFKDRGTEISDILANVFGTIIGILFFFIIYGKQPK